MAQNIDHSILDDAINEFHLLKLDELNGHKQIAGFIRSGIAGNFEEHKKLKIPFRGVWINTKRKIKF